MDAAKSQLREVDVFEFDEDVYVQPPCEIDAVVADNLTIALMSARVMDRSLVLDLSNVIFIDSAGLSVIVEARNRIAALGGELVIRRPQEQARRLFAMTELENFSITYD